MQSKIVITIVHSMSGMCGMYNYMCVIWNTDVGLMLKYSTLLLVCTWRTCDSSFNTIFVCENFLSIWVIIYHCWTVHYIIYNYLHILYLKVTFHNGYY